MKNRFELREEYTKHGIDFVYNDRQRVSYLKILGAPTFVEGGTFPEGCAPLTGWYRVPGGIKAVQEVELLSRRAKDLYREQFSDNPLMLKFLEPQGGPAKRSEFGAYLIFDEELCVQDEKHECIDGYLQATDGLVSRLKSLVASRLTENEISDMENMNFYVLYNASEGSINLTATFWYTTDDGYYLTHDTQQIPLNEEEAAAMRSAMETYCQTTYQMSCQGFLNEARAEAGLPALYFNMDGQPAKPSLSDRIRAAEQQQKGNGLLAERSEPVR